MKTNLLTNLSVIDEVLVSAAGRIQLLLSRKPIASLYSAKCDKLVHGESHHKKHVNPYKGGKALREVAPCVY